MHTVMRRKLAGLVACLGAVWAADAPAQVADTPAAAAAPAAAAERSPQAVLAEISSLTYQPRARAEGRVRLTGSHTLQQVAALWSQGFTAIHPGVACTIDSGGSSAGWKALGDGTADVALLSRPVADADREAYEKKSGKRLAVVAVGFDHLVWIVNAANPVASLPWSPKTGILRAGADGAVATKWAALNGDAAWKDTSVSVHGRDHESGTRWHLDRLLTGASNYHLDVQEHRAEAELADAVAADRGGLGLVSQKHGHWPGVKPLALEIPAGDAPLADAVAGSARTPDCRPLFVAFGLPREGEPPALVREFLAYVLSYSGQLDAAKDGLLPLTRAELHAQREIVGGPTAR
jgi:phosphate transport system substrate-binding protein